MTESDYETAYVCLRRAMDICLIVNNKRDNDSFRKTEVCFSMPEHHYLNLNFGTSKFFGFSFWEFFLSVAKI